MRLLGFLKAIPTGLKPPVEERKEDPYEMRTILNVGQQRFTVSSSSRFAGDDVTTPTFDQLMRRNEVDA